MTFGRFQILSAGLLVTCGFATSLSMVSASCSQTPAPVPIRTFERAGRMDVLCMQVLDANNTPIAAVPVTQDHCAPVATGVDPTTLPFHLMAVVTQTLRGELAVVDLTAAHVVDTSRAVPGINFLPVGQNPTDVAVLPDASMVFVAAAEVNKPAIYAIPSTLLLGDAANLDEPSQAAEALALTSWPVCALPQSPGRMVIVPTPGQGGDSGTPQGFELVVVLPGNGSDETAKAVLIDTAPFSNGTIAPGSLTPCPIKAAVELGSALPNWAPGPAWPNGLPYVDGGVDLFTSSAAPSDAGAPLLPSSNYKLPLWSCPGLAHQPGGQTSADAGALHRPPGGKPHAVGAATDGRYVWIADDGLPIVHVIDTTQAGALTELAPLVATSLVDPKRTVKTTEIAVSPATRDYKRFLYAIDQNDTGGSIIVYDVTDPVNGPHSPLLRPNAELDPFQPSDRIRFSSPVATISFARHDFPLTSINGQPLGAAISGELCNPNPNATDPGADPGIAYRWGGPTSVGLGPLRLRGVFAFATLTNGQLVTVDVDDWDAPCRRPALLDGKLITGSLAVPETASNDTDPYHAPNASLDGGVVIDSGLSSFVTNETFWPMILPHRARSMNIILDDSTGVLGLHDPELVSTPQLLLAGAPISTTAKPYAFMLPAFPEFPSVAPSPLVPPNVFVAHDTPDVHLDQDWTITYEGSLPLLDGVPATLASTDSYASLTLTNTAAFFCGRGVEDSHMAAQRFAAMQVDDNAMNKPTGFASYIPIHTDTRLGDYIQFSDDLVGAADAGLPIDDYWRQDNDCWDVDVGGQSLASSGGANDQLAVFRQQVCIDKFGAYGVDQNPQRDFPILDAFEDHLIVGRYLYTDPINRPTNGRVVAPRDTSTQVDFKMAKCCFHNQGHVKVRTGGEWVAIGSQTGYLSHLVADPTTNACVASCSSREVLLNARAPEFSVPSLTATGIVIPNRNSPFSLRTPTFSVFFAAPIVTGDDATKFFSISTRDLAWKFTLRQGYSAQVVNLASLTTAVVPQSSMFIAPLGMLAVVDGSAEGLFLVDLNTLAIAGGSPFF